MFHLPCPAPRRWWAGAPRASVCRRAWTGSPTGSLCHTDASHQTLPGLRSRAEVRDTKGGDKEQIRPGPNWEPIYAKVARCKIKKKDFQDAQKTLLKSTFLLKPIFKRACLTARFTFRALSVGLPEKKLGCKMAANWERPLLSVTGHQRGTWGHQVGLQRQGSKGISKKSTTC